ncbi:MAG TPA: tetraacyldisaccharide 4'-kinase [Terriglobales bacterium]|nr:tetraacyldisaccharide 4'-kinase [Terriglobales bacterium]
MNPLTGIYRAASGLRNSMFDRGWLAAKRLNQLVVSVGNLSVGGAGKTPFVIALGEELKARGIAFDVLSRGYGRRTTGVLVVDPDGVAADFGDEPLLIARRVGVPVIVGESRYEAGLAAEAKFEARVHILDDGFQHRSLARDFDIVLLTEHDFTDRLLPSGRLREPLSSLGRADAIVLPEGLDAECRDISGKVVWRMKRQMNLADAPKAPVVFCGIARPEQFFRQVREMLRETATEPSAELEFRDHHAYSLGDIEQLLAARERHGAGGFVTTEKDAINLGPLRGRLDPLAIATLNVILENPADIVGAIVERIKK